LLALWCGALCAPHHNTISFPFRPWPTYGATITSGAMVGRCGFIGDLLYSVGVTGFIYPIIGHWNWGRPAVEHSIA
jgi:ammonia channel protein AmtB